ncbi:MAG: phenylalanine--tRNA ligase subunit alpha [Candidatus Nitrosocaldaceae archaeon]|nr:MAG: phenylalanine--tRNA ligase subunit alpha [Candidatus Nitrosocaldaceae archaeon]
MIDPRTLHDIERRIILALRDKKMSIEALAKETNLSIDQIRRGIEWLKYKNLINVSEKVERIIELDSKGREALEKGLPERILINKLKEVNEISIKDLKQKLDLNNEFNAAIANAKTKGLIAIEKGVVKLLDDKKGNDELLLERLKEPISYDDLSKDELEAYNILKKRPNYIKEEVKKIIEVSLTDQGYNLIDEISKIKERIIDVEAQAPIIYAGRKHPLQDVIDEVREVLIGLGFQEIDGNYIQSSFWNFDILFTPQDHPAREMQDTFYLNAKSDEKIDERIIKKVANIHKNGWHYRWDREESRRLVLRTHTTSITIRYLADNKPEEASIFSVGRVFRNEKLTYKHLAEFHQVEGIMTNENVTLRDLMGLQREFYYKLGLKKVKFWPTYFPYTEPSLQSMVYHERLGKWVELFGMGIFRPEVTAPTGVKNPVLAWGGGLERIAMLKYNLDDVRELYANKLSWLRGVPKCQL